MQLVIGAPQLGHEAVVPRGEDQLFLLDEAQHLHRVMVGLVPQVRVELPEEFDRLMIPAPSQVVGQLFEDGKLARQGRLDAESLDGPRHPFLLNLL